MRETHSKPGPLLRRLLALGLVAWLAGLGCVLGCGAAVSPAAGGRAGVLEEPAAESCAAMSGGHGCCRRAKERGGTAAAEAPERHGDAAAHCPLSRQTSDPARKVRTGDAPVAATAPAQTHDSEPRQLYQSSAPRPRAHDRGGTYLRCCVFLI
jgi:hypothetical protein